MPPPKPSAPNPDYQQCPYCERRFQVSAAERHIPFCKEQASRKARKVTNPDGQDKLSKRMQVHAHQLYNLEKIDAKSLSITTYNYVAEIRVP